MFRKMADAQPLATANIEDSRRVTFAQLDSLANSNMEKFYKERPAYVGAARFIWNQQIWESLFTKHVVSQTWQI